MYGALLLFESEFVHIVAISFTSLILTELLMVALTIQTWHWLMTVAELLSLACYVASLVFLHEFIGKSPAHPQRRRTQPAHRVEGSQLGKGGGPSWPGPCVQQAFALSSPPCLTGIPWGKGPLTVGLLELRPVGVISVLSVVFKPRPVRAGLEGDLFNVRPVGLSPGSWSPCWALWSCCCKSSLLQSKCQSAGLNTALGSRSSALSQRHLPSCLLFISKLLLKILIKQHSDGR